MNKAHVRLCYVPVEVTASAADARTRFLFFSAKVKVYPIWIRVTHRKNGFINTSDISVKVRKMSKRKKTSKPKKVDFLELSSSKKARLIKKAKENLRQKLMEAEFWQSFAKTERVTINGQTIQF